MNSTVKIIEKYKKFLKTLNLLTYKPMLYVLNIDDNTTDKEINKIKSEMNDDNWSWSTDLCWQ